MLATCVLLGLSTLISCLGFYNSFISLNPKIVPSFASCMLSFNLFFWGLWFTPKIQIQEHTNMTIGLIAFGIFSILFIFFTEKIKKVLY